ncbi:MAG: hypothetical protein CVT84_03655 [Alphaproteobacteria bacterium HGW-Alphaproteobacteria-6]|nr:MAG: hypothetical protein CVT84_03655 [Alphaproteobacteria bacterium HGW-Alphaproteobacteria-6]
MNEHRQAAFEAFLVEDVILTLANLRASLAWLGEDGEATKKGEGADADRMSWRRAGLARIDCQIGMLEDRARAVCRSLGRTEPSDAACDAPAPSATPGETPSATADAALSAGADATLPAEADATLSPALPAPPSIAEAIRDALGTGADRGDADRIATDRGDPWPDRPRDSFGAPVPDPDTARQGAAADRPAPPVDTAGEPAPQDATDSGPGITAPAPWLGDPQDGGQGRGEDWLQDAAQDAAEAAAPGAAEAAVQDTAEEAVEGGPAPVFRSRRAG